MFVSGGAARIIAGVDRAKLKQGVSFVLGGLNQLLWPAVCINCHENIGEDDNNLCRNCWGELLECTGGDYCPRCGRDASRFAIVAGKCPDCQGREFYFDEIARAGVYDQSLQKMILSFKNSRTELDLVLGFLADSALQGSSFSKEVELFVPVPLHWTRRLVRGYNQSLVIAKEIKASDSKNLYRPCSYSPNKISAGYGKSRCACQKCC